MRGEILLIVLADEPNYYFGGSEVEVWEQFLEDFGIDLEAQEEEFFSLYEYLTIVHDVRFMDMVNILDEKPFFFPLVHRLDSSISDIRKELEDEEILETTEVIL